MLIATTPPMTPPATATVDRTALLSELGIAVDVTLAEVVPVVSAVGMSLCVCGDSIVLNNGVATGSSVASSGEAASVVVVADSVGLTGVSVVETTTPVLTWLVAVAGAAEGDTSAGAVNTREAVSSKRAVGGSLGADELSGAWTVRTELVMTLAVTS